MKDKRCTICNEDEYFYFDRWCADWVCDICGHHENKTACPSCGWSKAKGDEQQTSHADAIAKGWPCYRAVIRDRNDKILSIHEQCHHPDTAVRIVKERMRWLGYASYPDALRIRVELIDEVQ